LGGLSVFFLLGDYVAGMAIGAITALVVHITVDPGMDMVIAMLLGMVVGAAAHFVLGLLLTPLLGMFEIMIPGSVIGMYGGMLFAMRDSMGAGSRTAADVAGVGALFGAVVVIGLKIYERTIRGVVLDDGDG